MAGKLRLKKKEHTLLLNSNVINDYPWLCELLENESSITEELVNSLSQDKKNFFDYTLNNIIQQATNEWTGDEDHPVDDLENDRIPCALCGTNTRYVFYIYNQLNNKNMNVGSECVKHFGINVNRSGKTVEQLKKEATKIKHLNKLNDKFPGIDKLITNWSQELYRYPIIIPARLEKPFLELGEKAKSLLDEYLEEQKIDKDYFEEFEILIDKREKLIKEIEDYVSQNKSRLFIPTREVEIWLENRRRHEALKWLKEDEEIKWRTAHRIEEPNFMRLLATEFNEKLASIGFEIAKVDDDRRCYVFTPHSNRNIRLYNKHKDFVLYYGGLLFGDEPLESFDFQTLLNRFKVYDETSTYELVRELQNITKPTSISFWALDFKFNEIVIHEISNGKYLIVNLSDIIDKFKGLAFNTKDVSTSDLINYINKLPNQRYDKKEFLDLYERYKDSSTRI